MTCSTALHFFEYAGLFADLVTGYILVPCSVALRFFEYAGLFKESCGGASRGRGQEGCGSAGSR